MATDTARISVAALPAALGDCELCATGAADLTAVVVVQHSRGGAVQFLACDRCASAVRRVAAAAGGQARFAADVVAAAGRPAAVEAEIRPRAAAPVGSPQLVREFLDHVRGEDGTAYVVRVYGQARTGGTWTGWIEFAAVGADRVLRTGQETTQSTLADLAYWASGLEASYLEGAFARAHPAAATVT